MSSLSTLLFSTCLLVSLCITHRPSFAQGQNGHGALNREKSFWSGLQFTSSTLLAKLKVEIFLDSATGETPFSSLAIDLPDDSTASEHRLQLTVDFAVQGAFLGETRYKESTIFNESTLLPYQRNRVMDNGTEKWVKVYYWQEKGVRRHRILPANDREENLSPERWTRRTTSFYPYPQKSNNCGTILDASLLLYLLSTRTTDQNQAPFTVCVFGKKQLHRLSIAQTNSTPISVAFLSRSASQNITVAKETLPLVYAIAVETIPPANEEPETFSFFGLNNDIRIAIDKNTRLPLRIQGINNSIGPLVLNLQEVSWQSGGELNKIPE